MHLPSPRTLNDVIADGVFVAAAQDLAFDEAMGQVTMVEYNFSDADPKVSDSPVDVRINSSTGTHDVIGHRVAVIVDNQWTWATDAATGLDVPELHGTHPYSANLLRAARTLVAGRPVLIAQQNQHLCAVAVDFRGAGVPEQASLAHGLAHMPLGTDEQRALTAFAVSRGQEGVQATLHEGYIAQLGTGGLSLEDVRADGFYRTAEQQLFINGRYPRLQVQVDVDSGRAHIASTTGSFVAKAHIIATVSEDVWTWAWADPGLKNSPCQRASWNVRRFGQDNGIGALLRPHTPVAMARKLGLAQATMPILQVWTLHTVALSSSTLGLVLLEAPQFQLPPLSDAARAATLHIPLPTGLDERRARAAYAALRG